jgi:hypothetical protein
MLLVLLTIPVASRVSTLSTIQSHVWWKPIYFDTFEDITVGIFIYMNV